MRRLCSSRAHFTAEDGEAQGGKSFTSQRSQSSSGTWTRIQDSTAKCQVQSRCKSPLQAGPQHSDSLSCRGRLPSLRCPQMPPGRQFPVQQQEVGPGPTHSWLGGLYQPGHKGWTTAATQMGRKFNFPPLPPGQLARHTGAGPLYTLPWPKSQRPQWPSTPRSPVPPAACL